MSGNFLEQWINTDDKAEVVLLSAPVTFPPVPSIALSIFKSELKAKGISSKAIYSIFSTIHLLGADNIYELSKYVEFMRDAEFIFAHMTDNANAATLQEYMDFYCR